MRLDAALSVLTFNVFAGPPTPTPFAAQLDGSDRLRHQVAQIRALKPDIICLQEVQTDGVREYYTAKLQDTYEASFVLTADEFRCKAGRLMRKALDHIGPQTTLSGFLLGPVQSGLMVLHRREVLERASTVSSFTFREQSGDPLNFVRPRGALCVPLRLRSDGSPLCVINTHANAESASFFGAGALFGGHGMPSVPKPSSHRARQLEELFEHAERLAKEGSRLVVCGDLNSPPELGEIPARPYDFIDATAVACQQQQQQHEQQRQQRQQMQQMRPLPHASCLYTWDGTRNPLVEHGWFSKGEGERTQLDYIFTSASSGLQPVSARLVLDCGPPWLSDHFGVLASLCVKPYVARKWQQVRKRLEGRTWTLDEDGVWGL